MFTGLITDIGVVTEVTELNHGKRFKVRTGYDTSTIDIGASISHAGTCLTVTEKGTEKDNNWFCVEAWEEALRLTSLGDAEIGTRLNLERSLKIGDELGGHLVSGHVDGRAEIVEIIDEGDARRYVLEAPEELAKFIATKGSICLDGTSLTVNNVEKNRFDVLLIRHSREVTTWGEAKVGDRVNLEIDQMARYAARLSEMS